MTFRHIPFDVVGYARAMDEQGVESPLWVADYLNARAAAMERRKMA